MHLLNAGATCPKARFISLAAHLPLRAVVLITCLLHVEALPSHAQTWSRYNEGKGRAKGGILIALPEQQLKSFGHKCEDEECGHGKAPAPAAEGPPSLFQAGASIQPRPEAAEVFPEADHVSNFSGLLQLSPRSAGATAQEGQETKASERGELKDEEVLTAMREAVQALEVKRRDDPVDTVLNALKDGQGAQDPTFNANGSVVPEAQLLAALEDGLGAQDPGAERPTRVSAVTVQENVSHGNHSVAPRGTALPGPVEHALRRSFWSTRSGALAAAVGFVAATWLAVICLATGFWMAVFSGSRSNSSLRSSIETHRRYSSKDLKKLMPSSGGYDCAFSKPVSSKQLLRLEVRVEGPEMGSATLKAPLTGRSCVLHSAAVCKQLHDGMPSVPVAFSASSVDFMVTLVDDKETCIHIKGEEVSLFDMVNGKCIEQTTFDAAPDSWQDFVMTHRAAPPQGAEWSTSSSLRADDATLEFQEASLLVGSTVTVVGELHRGVDGKLALRPWNGELKNWRSKKLREAWRTSWEGEKAARSAPDVLKKVLVSDDEELLLKDLEVEGKLRECATGLGNLLG